METITVQVVNNTKSGDVITLRLKRPIGFSFTPGQCIDLYDDEGNCRPYSIASGVARDAITLYIKYIPDGKVTSWVDTLAPNDSVRISREPYGYFAPGTTDKPFVFISTGTGVAPFMSYIESHSDMPDLYQSPPAAIIAGLRYIDDGIWISPITQFAKDFRFCITQGDITGLEDVAYNGRVTDFVKNEWDIDVNAVYYLCGLDSMLNEMSEILCDAGVPVDNIVQELFYFS